MTNTTTDNESHPPFIVEYNLDVVKMADHVIDVGPEGGHRGGEGGGELDGVVFTGGTGGIVLRENF